MATKTRSRRSTKQPASAASHAADPTSTTKPAPPDGRSLPEERDLPTPPQIAIASDGRLLLSTEELAGHDLTGRETFTGIFLTQDEARGVIGRIDAAAADSASRLTAKLLKR